MKTIMLSDETIYRCINLLTGTMSNEEALHDGLVHTLFLAYHSRGEIAIEQEWCPTHGWVASTHTCPERDHTGE